MYNGIYRITSFAGKNYTAQNEDQAALIEKPT